MPKDVICVEVDHVCGDIVYKRTATENEPGCVTGYTIRPSGLLYIVEWGNGSQTSHYGFELKDEYAPVVT